jgi:uncharacterized repeat protein (TIGR01451 family)
MLKTLNKWIKTSTPWQTLSRFFLLGLFTCTFIISTVTLFGIAPPATAQLAANECVPNVFYASQNGGTGLFAVDIGTGKSKQVGNLFFQTAAISRDAETGRIFYIQNDQGGGISPVRFFDPITGGDQFVGNTNVNPRILTPNTIPLGIEPVGTDVFIKMAQRANGDIYASTANNRVFVVNKNNGATSEVTILPPLPIGSGDIAFSPTSTNKLFVTVLQGTNNVELYEINLTTDPVTNVTTGASTLLGTSTLPHPVSNSTAFGPDGNLYISERTAGNITNLYRMSTTDASTVLVQSVTDYNNPLISPSFSDFGTLPTLSPNVVIDTEKTASNAAVVAGSPLTYTIRVTNRGTCDARGLKLQDVLPLQLLGATWTSKFVLSSDEAVAGTGQMIPGAGSGNIDSIVNLNAGSRLVVTVTGTVNPVTLDNTNISNTAVVISDRFLESTVNTLVINPLLGIPDLEIVKTGPNTYTPGGNITYNLRIRNLGNATANNTIVNDPAPTGGTFVSNSGDCNTAFPCNLGNLDPGTVRNISTTFTINGVAGRLSNTATVNTQIPTDEFAANDPGRLLLRNNTSTFTTDPPASPPPVVPPIVPPVVDVAIGVTAPPSVPPGSTFNVTLTARNLGTANADNVTVSYDVPPGVTVVSVPDGCVYNATASTIVCTPIPSFSRGATTNYNFVFKAPDTPISLTGIARISTTSAEPNTGNNSAAATTTVATDAPNPNPPTDPNTGLPIIPLIPIIPPPSPLPLIPSIIGTTLQINNPPTNNRNGTETVQFTVTITNTSTQPLSDLQAIIDLVRTFSGVQGFVVVSVDSSNFVINPAFNGTDLQNLLGAGNILNPGATGRITFRVQVTPGINTGPYFASVTVRGTDPNGNVVSDVSTDGTIADANGNGTTSDDNTPTTIQFTGLPNIRLVKRMTNAFRNGVAVSGIDFNTLINDANDVNDDAPGWANLSPLGLVRIGETGLLQSGDQLEYTVYFLSDGTGTADNFLFCDPTPAGASFLGDTYGTGLGSLLRLDGVETPQTNATDTDAGRFIPPLTPAPSPCPSPNNPNGAVYMQIPRVSNRSPNNVGFVRFRVLLQ